MNILMIGDEPDTLRILHFVCERLRDWNITAIQSSGTHIDRPQMIDRVLHATEDVVVLLDRGVLYHFGRTMHQSKPIIGCDRCAVPESNRRLRAAGIWTVDIPCIVDEFLLTVNLVACINGLQRFVPLPILMNLFPVAVNKLPWEHTLVSLQQNIDCVHQAFDRFETEHGLHFGLGTRTASELSDAFEAFCQKMMDRLLWLVPFVEEAQRRLEYEVLMYELHLHTLQLFWGNEENAFARIDAISNGLFRLNRVTWKKRPLTNEFICEGTATDILDHVERLVYAVQQEGASI